MPLDAVGPEWPPCIEIFIIDVYRYRYIIIIRVPFFVGDLLKGLFRPRVFTCQLLAHVLRA